MQQEAAASEHLQPWWYRLRWRAVSKGEARHAERLLLTHSNTSSLTASDVSIGPGKHDYMHTIIGGQTNADSPQLVCIPGYGAGAAFMFRIFEGLSAGFRMFAVDLLGTGLSGRPAFKARSTSEAEDFFIDSFEKWRAATGVSGMVLVGHSLGGYLSAVYALKYPHHVKHLILVCPAGVGKRPADWQPPESLRSPWTVRGQLYRTAVKAWNGGVTPGSIIRGLGPWGKSLVEGYAQRRFRQGHRLNEDEVMAFQQYM
jgi:abhydrolase domain-containing protein 5